MTFDVASGEIVGLIGVHGSGAYGLRAIFGVEDSYGGEIDCEGRQCA